MLRKWLRRIGVNWLGKDVGYFEMRNWWRWVLLGWFLLTVLAVVTANQYWGQLNP